MMDYSCYSLISCKSTTLSLCFIVRIATIYEGDSTNKVTEPLEELRTQETRYFKPLGEIQRQAHCELAHRRHLSGVWLNSSYEFYDEE